MSHYQVRIDHRTKSLSFGTDLGVSQKEDIPEGPYIQSMPSEQIRNQVINIAQALNQAMEIIGPKESTLVRNRTFIIFFINNFFLYPSIIKGKNTLTQSLQFHHRIT